MAMNARTVENAAAGPHHGQPIVIAGEPLEQARAAMVLAHGRGASASDILTIPAEVAQSGFVYLAPQAAGNTWYPNRFMEPIASNEPWLTSALATLEGCLALLEQAGFLPERTILLGFSQGACLMTEFVARHARRYGGIVGFSGGLIGPDGTPRDYPGSFAGTPAFLGCSDVDPHVPKERVQETAEVFQRLGAQVTLRLYPGMGHTVNADELAHLRRMMQALL
jgi:predicted esterase